MVVFPGGAACHGSLDALVQVVEGVAYRLPVERVDVLSQLTLKSQVIRQECASSCCPGQHLAVIELVRPNVLLAAAAPRQCVVIADIKVGDTVDEDAIGAVFLDDRDGDGGVH